MTFTYSIGSRPDEPERCRERSRGGPGPTRGVACRRGPPWLAGGRARVRSSDRGGSRAGVARTTAVRTPGAGRRRTAMVLAGVVLVIVGVIWILQGAGTLKGSFMTGSAF